MYLISLAFAQSQAPASSSAHSGSLLSAMMPFLIIIFIFYFLLIRPQQKRMKDHQKLLDQLKRGDKVVTSGGILGQVFQVRGNTVELEVGQGLKITFNKSAISNIIKDNTQANQSSQPKIS